jgi:hypothetical protein
LLTGQVSFICCTKLLLFTSLHHLRRTGQWVERVGGQATFKSGKIADR